MTPRLSNPPPLAWEVYWFLGEWEGMSNAPVLPEPSRPLAYNSRLKLALVALSTLAICLIVVWKITDAPTTPTPTAASKSADQFSLFDLSKLAVNREELLLGGKYKDEIVALSHPKVVAADRAEFLKPNERVIGIQWDGETRAYPVAILNHHELINDTIGKTPIVVAYCPLCDAAQAFDRRTPIGLREFGVSGMIYNSNTLMYDRGGEPESLWSHSLGMGISGPAINKKLKTIPVEVTTWGVWKDRYPETKVVSIDTGQGIDYFQNPFAGYAEAEDFLVFPIKLQDNRLGPKAKVLGVWTDKSSRAYPLARFSANRAWLEDEIDGKKITLEFDHRAQSLRIVKSDEGIQWTYAYWFSWYASHPDTVIAD